MSKPAKPFPEATNFVIVRHVISNGEAPPGRASEPGGAPRHPPTSTEGTDAMNTRLQARIACHIPWCTEQPARHDKFHLRVLFSHVAPSPGSTSGAVQLAAFANGDDKLRLSLILVNRDLAAMPERVAISPSWEQAREIAFALVSDKVRMVWDVARADASEPASFEIRPSRYGGSLQLTAAQYDPIRSLTALLDTGVARRMSEVMLGARSEFRAFAA